MPTPEPGRLPVSGFAGGVAGREPPSAPGVAAPEPSVIFMPLLPPVDVEPASEGMPILSPPVGAGEVRSESGAGLTSGEADAPATVKAEAMSGDAEGAASGDTEGVASGDAEGVASGDAEGVASGDAEGVASGDAEGVASGDAEGVAVGVGVGLVEGWASMRASSSAMRALRASRRAVSSDSSPCFSDKLASASVMAALSREMSAFRLSAPVNRRSSM